MLKVLVMAAPLVLSTAAFAQPSRVSDAEFIAAARCQALMASSALGRQDTRGIDQVLDAQSTARQSDVLLLADDARDDAQTAARQGGLHHRAQLAAVRDGVCQAFTGGATMSASVTQAGATRTN